MIDGDFCWGYWEWWWCCCCRCCCRCCCCFDFSSICCCLHNSIASDAQSLAAMVQATPLESFSRTGGKTSSLSQKKPKYSAPKMSHLCPSFNPDISPPSVSGPAQLRQKWPKAWTAVATIVRPQFTQRWKNMALDSPARWGFACKFSVRQPCSARRQKIFPNWEISLDLLQYYFPGWLSRCQKIFHTICQKALRHLLANSAFRSFGEVTQNFRANRRTAPKKC